MSRRRRWSRGTWIIGLAIAGIAALVGRGTAATPPGADVPGVRPGASTTPTPRAGAAGAAGAADPDLARLLRAVSAADHRWFLGLRRRGIGGYGIGHQGPEMPADQFGVVSIVGAPPQALVAYGPRAWLIAAPLAPGAESPVFSIRLARNDIYETWYATGRSVLRPLPRLPAGVLPLAATASPAGPILVAEPAAPGGRLRLLRLGVDRWTETELGDPPGVPATTLAAERPLAMAVVRVPGPGADPPADGPGGADAPDAAAADAAAADDADDADDADGDPDAASDPAAAAESDAGASPPPAAARSIGAGTVTVTVLLVAGPDELAVDYIAPGGERWRAWSGRPEVATEIREAAASGVTDVPDAPDVTDTPDASDTSDTSDASDPPDAPDDSGGPVSLNPPFHATIFEVDGRIWLATRTGDELRMEPFTVVPPLDAADAAAAIVAPLVLGGGLPEAIVVELGDAPVTVIGGDGPALLEGDVLDDPEDPARVRAWTPGGIEDLDGPLTAQDVDPSVLLRGPIIMGTGVFFAVIAGVLTSRPGPRPPAIEGREAPVGRRLLAALIDAVAPVVAAMLVFKWTPDAMLGSMLLLHPGGYAIWISVTLLWAFATIVGDLAGGRTPGRLLMRIRPVDAGGGRPSRGRLVLRFTVRLISVAYPPLILFWLAHARGRALHDLAARTWVIRTDVPASSDRTSPSGGAGGNPGDA
jgi:uncharacterized RDD family membrane protein YckC